MSARSLSAGRHTVKIYRACRGNRAAQLSRQWSLRCSQHHLSATQLSVLIKMSLEESLAGNFLNVIHVDTNTRLNRCGMLRAGIC